MSTDEGGEAPCFAHLLDEAGSVACQSGPVDGADDGGDGDLAYGEFPLRRHLGLALGGAEPGRATCTVEVGEHHLNPNGVVHGAVLFAMLDTAMGKAAMSVLDEGQFCATADLDLRFVRPASASTVTAEVEVLKRGRNLLHLEGRVHDAEGRLVATAAATFAVLTF